MAGGLDIVEQQAPADLSLPPVIPPSNSLCLVKLGVLNLETEAPAIVLRIFWTYINVMREIQSTYWLEPAGSHGVWGLDDYHFLPFLFGSAQLKSHKYFKPKAIHDPEILDEFSAEYMYFACIHFINSVSCATRVVRSTPS